MLRDQAKERRSSRAAWCCPCCCVVFWLLIVFLMDLASSVGSPSVCPVGRYIPSQSGLDGCTAEAWASALASPKSVIK